MQGRLRVLLVVALAQALLAGIVALEANPQASSPEASSPEEGESGSGSSYQPRERAVGTSEPSAGHVLVDPPAPDMAATTPPKQPDEESTSPPDEGAPPSPPPGAEVVHGTYEELEPHEQASLAAPSPFQPVLEGRIPGGSYWGLSAHFEGDDVCMDFALGRSGEGDSLIRHCKAKDHWETAWFSTDGLAAFVGFAGLRAQDLEVVLKDGRAGRFPPGFLGESDVSFFVVWLSCGNPDVDRFRALDSEGRMRSQLRYGFAVPSNVCAGGG